MPLAVGDPVPDATLLAEGGRALSLAALCRRGPGPLVLVFLRHFG